MVDHGQKDKVLFMGSKNIGLSCLQTVHGLRPGAISTVLTIDDSKEPTGVLDQFRDFAAESSLPLYVVRDRQESARLIAEASPRLCLVVGWYWLLTPRILGLAPEGFYGLHSSLLPRYRGGSPLVWAILNGERETGITFFRFDAGMDTGPVCAQKRVEILPDDYMADVLAKINRSALKILEENYIALLDGKAVLTPQTDTGATYCAQRREEDGLINWSWRQLDVYNFIRCQSHPYPGAFTTLSGAKIRIWRASPLDMVYYGRPGQVAAYHDDDAIVICGDNRPLLVKQVQMDGESQEHPPATLLRRVGARVLGA